MYALTVWLSAAGPAEVPPPGQPSTPVVAARELRPLREATGEVAWTRHVVQRGETPEQIAERFGVQVLDLLDQHRRPLPTGPLRVGQVLLVPARTLPRPRQKRRLWVPERATWEEVAASHSTTTHPLDGDELRRQNPRYGRFGTVPPKRWISIWQDSGVRPTSSVGSLAPVSVGEPRGVSIGRPQVGRLLDGVQLQPSEGIEVLFPDAAWGTSLMIATIEDSVGRFRRETDFEGVVQIGAISHRKGGKFPPHRSHQSGRDVDIRLPAMPFAQGKGNLRFDEVDWHASWALLAAFVASGNVQAVFVDRSHQRRIREAAIRMGATDAEIRAIMGLVTHAPGHRQHLHVRVRCADPASRCKG